MYLSCSHISHYTLHFISIRSLLHTPSLHSFITDKVLLDRTRHKHLSCTNHVHTFHITLYTSYVHAASCTHHRYILSSLIKFCWTELGINTYHVLIMFTHFTLHFLCTRSLLHTPSLHSFILDKKRLN
jgi:hypothetical protein